MKTKLSVFLGTVMLATMLFIAPQESNAQTVAATVNINLLVQTGSVIQFRATEINGVFANKLFQINDIPKQNIQTAIALTAMSTDKPIRLFFTDSNNVNTASTVNSIGLLAQ